MRWLRRELQAASGKGERVILLSHAILAPGACEGTTMVWDYDVALELLDDAAEAGTVAMVICGHDHSGGYFRDARGVHHLTLKSPLNKGGDGKAFGLLRVFDDRIELLGPRLADLVPAGDERPRRQGTPMPEVVDAHEPAAAGAEGERAPCEAMHFRLRPVRKTG